MLGVCCCWLMMPVSLKSRGFSSRADCASGLWLCLSQLDLSNGDKMISFVSILLFLCSEYEITFCGFCTSNFLSSKLWETFIVWFLLWLTYVFDKSSIWMTVDWLFFYFLWFFGLLIGDFLLAMFESDCYTICCMLEICDPAGAVSSWISSFPLLTFAPGTFLIPHPILEEDAAAFLIYLTGDYCFLNAGLILHSNRMISKLLRYLLVSWNACSNSYSTSARSYLSFYCLCWCSSVK